MNKKSYAISVRVTKEILDKFNKLADYNSLNKSDYLNELIRIEYLLQERDIKEYYEEE